MGVGVRGKKVRNAAGQSTRFRVSPQGFQKGTQKKMMMERQVPKNNTRKKKFRTGIYKLKGKRKCPEQWIRSPLRFLTVRAQNTRD